MRMRLFFAAFLFVLALVARSFGQDSAQKWHEKARELGKANKLAEADNAYREALKDLDRNAKSNSAVPSFWASYYQCRCDHANLQTQMERYADAEKMFKTLLTELTAKIAQHPDEPVHRFAQAKAHDGLGEMYRAMERSAPAVVQYDEALGILRSLVETQPAGAEYREELATVLGRRALQQMNLARSQDAEASYREAVQAWHKLIVENPKSPEYREKLAIACNGYGLLARESARFLLARDLIRSAIHTTQTLHAAYPREPKYWHHLPTFYRNVAMPLDYLHSHAEKAAALRAAEKWESVLAKMSDESKSWLTEGQKIMGSLQVNDANRLNDQGKDVETHLKKAETLAKAHPDVPAYRGQWITAKITAATHSATSHRYDPALASYREALADTASLARDFPDVPAYRRLHASLQCKAGLVQLLRGDAKDGGKLIDGSFAEFRKLADDYPDEPKLRRAVDDESANIMVFHLSRNDDQKVIDIMRATSESLGKLCEKHPRCAEYRRHQAQAPVPLGHIYARMKRDGDAEKAFRESLRLWLKVIEDFPEVTEYHLFQCQVRLHLVQVCYRQARWAEAEALVLEMQRSHRKLIEAIPQLEHQHTGLAISEQWLATLAVRQKKLQPALDHYGQAIAICEKAFTAHPTERGHLHLLISALRERSALYQETGNFAAYDHDLQRSRAKEEWLDTPFVRLTRVAYQVDNDKIDVARREADDLFACGELTGTQWYQLAGIYAKLLKTADPAARDRCASCTITSLSKALDEGYRPTTPLRDDSQFRLLATRADFQQLVMARP